MANDSLTRLAALFKDVARRSERVLGVGNTSSQRQVASPSEVLGIEDYVIVGQVPDSRTMHSTYVEFGNGATGNTTIANHASINGYFGSGSGRTVSMWVYILPSLLSSSREMYLIDTTAGGASGWILSTDFTSLALHGTLTFMINFSSVDGQWTTTNNVIPIEEWTHVLIRYNGSDVAQNPTVFINGVSVDITEDTTPVGSLGGADSNTKHIGQDSTGAKKFQGYIDHMIWKDGGITASGVLDLMYAVPANSDPDLLVYIPFNETSGSTATDNSTNSNSVTLSSDVIRHSLLVPGYGYARVGEFVI